VVPQDLPRPLGESGNCRLLGRRNLFCDPPCTSDLTCGEGGKCIPAPTARSAGTVRIFGLAEPVTMMPSAHPLRYDYTRLPQPGFVPGADIQLQATGADVGPFLLRGWGVTAVELQSEATVLEPGTDLVLHWTPGPPGPARIAFELEIDQHGMTHAVLACEVPDDGTTTVPASLIDQLVALGASGLPKIRVARRTVDAATLATGCVQLQVTAAVERAVKVPGHDPCRSTGDCPAGKACDVSIETCH
jgi:hypothetical protein